MKHTSTEQPEALRLAHALSGGKLIDDSTEWADTLHAADAELRRQHARIAELEDVADMAIKRITELEAQLSAAQSAAQGMDAEIQQAVESERERICAAIKAEDDHCIDQGDYMLDSNDCIKIVRGKWVRPDYSLDAAQAKQGGAA